MTNFKFLGVKMYFLKVIDVCLTVCFTGLVYGLHENREGQLLKTFLQGHLLKGSAVHAFTDFLAYVAAENTILTI